MTITVYKARLENQDEDEDEDDPEKSPFQLEAEEDRRALNTYN